MKYHIEDDGIGTVGIVLSGLDQKQAQQVHNLVTSLVFNTVPVSALLVKPVSGDLIGVSNEEAQCVVSEVLRGYSSANNHTNKIEDIKYIRTTSGCGLKQALDFVNEYLIYADGKRVARSY